MKSLLYWGFRPVEELDREELLEVVTWLATEVETLRKDRDRWMIAGDAAKYLLAEKAL